MKLEPGKCYAFFYGEKTFEFYLIGDANPSLCVDLNEQMQTSLNDAFMHPILAYWEITLSEERLEWFKKDFNRYKLA